MFENEIKFISDFSLNKVKNFGSFVTFSKLSTSELHPAIVTYISAELDYMIYRDRKKLLNDSIFDYTGREISDHFNVIAAEIKKNKKISIDDIEKLIYQAVSFNLNYVVRPKWSVTKLVFNDQDFVSVDELEKMLNYLFYYDYVKNVLTAYTSRRKVTQLTLTEFDLILNKIDKELFKANTEELINNAVHSIADFFNIGGIDKTTISLAAVEIFLKEKNLTDYLLKIRHSISGSFRKKYEIADLKKVLFSKETVFPESISGSMDKDLSAADVSESVEEEVLPELEIDELEIESVDTDDIDIVAEEKIKSTDESAALTEEKIIIEEPQEESFIETSKEDLIAIEEETISEPDDQGEDTIKQVSKDDMTSSIFDEVEPIPVKDAIDTVDEDSFEDELLNIFDEEKDINQVEKKTVEESNNAEVTEPVTEKVNDLEVSGSFNEEVETKQEETASETPASEVDDLVTFYEKELADMDGNEDLNPSDFSEEEQVIQDELVIDSEEENFDELEEEIIDQETSELISESEEEKNQDILKPDDEFDLSIFEDDEALRREEEEILKNLKSDMPEAFVIDSVSGRADEKEQQEKFDESIKSESTETESKDEIHDEELSNSNKLIIDEMLNDYFSDADKKEESPVDEPEVKIVDETVSQENEEIQQEQVEPEEPESPVLPVEEKQNETFDESLFKDDLASDILKGTTSGDDISDIMSEIDDIIEKSNFDLSSAETKETKIDEEISEELELDEKFNLDKETVESEHKIDFKDESEIIEDISESDDQITDETPVEDTEDIYTAPPKQSPKSQPPPVREKDLFSYLSKKEVKKIVSSVFAADYEDFVSTIEKISECTAYKQATEILKGVFFTYRISPYSKEAVTLTNAVSHFFRQA